VVWGGSAPCGCESRSMPRQCLHRTRGTLTISCASEKLPAPQGVGFRRRNFFRECKGQDERKSSLSWEDSGNRRIIGRISVRPPPRWQDYWMIQRSHSILSIGVQWL